MGHEALQAESCQAKFPTRHLTGRRLRDLRTRPRFGSAEQAYFNGLCSTGRVQVAHVPLSLRGDDSIIWMGKSDSDHERYRFVHVPHPVVEKIFSSEIKRNDHAKDHAKIRTPKF